MQSFKKKMYIKGIFFTKFTWLEYNQKNMRLSKA